MSKLIVNGSVYSQLRNIDRLKKTGAQLKDKYPDATVSIEDSQGTVIHHFFS